MRNQSLFFLSRIIWFLRTVINREMEERKKTNFGKFCVADFIRCLSISIKIFIYKLLLCYFCLKKCCEIIARHLDEFRLKIDDYFPHINARLPVDWKCKRKTPNFGRCDVKWKRWQRSTWLVAVFSKILWTEHRNF